MRNELLLNFKMLKENYNELRSLCNSYEREIKELKQKIKEHVVLTNKDCLENNGSEKITKGDVFGIIDYLHDGLGDYIENAGGRPYDDDEILNIRNWVLRCNIWLNQKIKEME